MEKEYYFDTHISAPFNFQSFGNGFQNPNFENPIAQCSSLSTLVSSSSASNSATENFAVRELIGKLGNAGDISPEFKQRSSYMNSLNTSCCNTPINSPPELQLPIINHLVKENIPILRNPTPMNPVLAERAAKFSRFGNHSFNGRRSPIGINNAEFHSQLLGNGKFPRVSSSPSLNINGSSLANKNSIQNQMNLRSDNAELSVSEQNSIQEIGFPAPNELNSKKRKGFPRGKAKVAESNEHLDIKKRLKMTSGNENGGVKSEEENNAGREEVKKQANKNQKPTEPPKDYIHVRARRGEATDSHSLAERVRREKIDEKMKLLQDLVPGCSKVTGKALMLDEIINYVQSLQRQSEFLSMKLSTFNSSENVNMDNLVSNDMFQPNGSFSDNNIYPVESSASAYYGQQTPDVRNKQVEPLDETLCCNFSLQSSQFPAFSEDDLRSIVQTGFAPNPTSHMKIEL